MGLSVMTGEFFLQDLNYSCAITYKTPSSKTVRALALSDFPLLSNITKNILTT